MGGGRRNLSGDGARPCKKSTYSAPPRSVVFAMYCTPCWHNDRFVVLTREYAAASMKRTVPCEARGQSTRPVMGSVCFAGQHSRRRVFAADHGAGIEAALSR